MFSNKRNGLFMYKQLFCSYQNFLYFLLYTFSSLFFSFDHYKNQRRVNLMAIMAMMIMMSEWCEIYNDAWRLPYPHPASVKEKKNILAKNKFTVHYTHKMEQSTIATDDTYEYDIIGVAKNYSNLFANAFVVVYCVHKEPI